MEAILFVGIQASGKSTFYKNYYLNSHIRISNDLLRTKSRERKLFAFCFETGMPLVIDNTNVSKDVRAAYIELLKANRYRIKCYYFGANLERSLEWNRARQGRDLIPDVGILATHKRLQIPDRAEGFDELYYVDLIEGRFVVKEWEDEV